METTLLPHTDIRVSKICLGTMTWGRQNTEEEGHAQMDYALEQGVNFFDTAELYPVPAHKDRYAHTEKIIGNWFRKSGKRQQMVLATKIAGPAPWTAFIRTTGFRPDAIREAVEGSLRRLQTDYIDLYQLHWPERTTNFFGKRGYAPDPQDAWEDNIARVLDTLGELVREGKVRHVGLSNETPWGVMRFLEEGRADAGRPRMVAIQNPYNLLNRLFEVGLAEMSLRSGIGLLAYSPLGFGTLSGKYLGGKKPDNARVTLFPNYNRYSNARAVSATEAYADIASRHGLSLAQMALAFVNSRPFVTSNIIGATSMAQLRENIGSAEITLSDAILEEIAGVHEAIPNPAP